MQSKEEIEKAYWKGYIQKQNEAVEICKQCKYRKKARELESKKQKLIEKLKKDIVNITKTMQDGKHWDDYSRCRLKAYRTKTKEILKILKGEKQ